MEEIIYNVTTKEESLFDTMVDLISRIMPAKVRVREGIGGEKEIHFEDTDSQDAGTYVFRVGGYDSDSEGNVGIDDAGASWFRAMRGDRVADAVRAQNAWMRLIGKIAQDFYDNNPLLVYVDTSADFRARAEGQVKNISSAVRTFFDEADADIRPDMRGEKIKIYAASMSMKIRTSVGEPTPVIGKIYFYYEDGSVSLLTKEDATEIEEQLKGQKLTERAAAPTEMIPSNVYNAFGARLDKTKDYDRCIYFNDDNQAIVDELTESLRRESQSSAVEVEITDVMKANIYFIINVQVATFKVMFTSARRPVAALNAKVLFNRISLSCLHCDQDATVISDNVIKYQDAKGQDHQYDVIFEGDKVCLGDEHEIYRPGTVKYEKLLNLLKKEVFSKHLKRVECSACGARPSCIEYVCESKQLPVATSADGDITEIKCAECRYPETYVLVDGKAYSPNVLYYDADKKSFVNGEHVPCAVCGRDIAKVTGRTTCRLCSSIVEDAQGDSLSDQKRLYRRYSGLLRLSQRLGRVKKRCVEDESTIVFRVGSAYYTVDKLDGFINGFRVKKQGK